MTKDYADLRHWVAQHFNNSGQTPPDWQPITGDAGFRRYFRLPGSAQVGHPPKLAVAAPPETENSQAFVAIARHLEKHGLAVPRIHAVDYDRGFLLVEDLGEALYLPHLNDGSVDNLYGEALQALLQLQSAPVDSQLFPPYDTAKLRQEMELLPQWFIEKLLGHSLNTDERELLNRTFARLEQEAAKQPKRIVHRDFHSRNLILRTGSEGQILAPGLIDFQDALSGPVTYDLVSLLRDCYVHWPRQRVEQWALEYCHAAQGAGIIPQLRDGEFLRWFDWMGLQRHIKVLGIFARLSLRDGKHNYLQDLPLVLAYTLSVARRYPEFIAFTSWFEQQLMPRVQSQPWFSPVSADL